MKSKLLKTLQYVFFLFTALILLYFAFRNIDINEVIQQIRHADYRWVATSVVFGALALVFRALRWRLLIEPLNKKPSRINIFHAINIGYLANFVFPRIGEVTRCGILNRTDRIPADKLFGTVIVERLFDILTTIFMLFIILLMRFNLVMENILLPAVSGMSNLINILLTIVIIALIIFAINKFLGKRLLKIKIMQKINDMFNGVAEGIKSIKSLRKPKLFIILTFFLFGMYYMQTYTMFFALESAASLGLGDALFILVLSSLAFIIPAPGGFGAYHLIVAIGMTKLGVTDVDGQAYATLAHSSTSILLIMMGMLSLIIVFSKKNNIE